MKKSSLFVLFVMMAAATWAVAPEDSLITEFDRTGNYETANRFFDRIYRSGLLPTPQHMTKLTPKDSLRQQVWYWAGEYFYSVNNYEQASVYAMRALPLISKGTELEADCQSLLAITNMRMAHYAKAIGYAQRCHKLDMESGDEDRISSSLNTLAAIYLTAGQPSEAEKYVLRGIEMAQKSDNTVRMAVLKGMASEVYHALGRDSLALAYIDEAYRLDSMEGHTNKMYVRMAQRASVLIGLNRYEEAEQVLNSVIPYLRRVGDSHSLGIALNKLGNVLSCEGRTDECVNPYREAADIFARLGDPYNEIHAHRGLYEALWKTNRDEAKLHFDRFTALKDSIYNHSSAESLARYNAEFGNDWLMLENHSEHRERLIAYYIMVAGVLLTVVVVVVMHRRNRRQIRLNEKLQAVVEELKEEQLHEGTEGALDQEASDDFGRRVMDSIRQNMATGQMDVRSVAESVGLSPSKFRQELEKITDESAANFILHIRMQRAIHLLETHHKLTIQEVATLCGYSETSNFIRTFKKFTGQTPQAYRNN